jgi:hypothetical protein
VLAERPAILVVLLVALNLLSAADWMLTARALANGAAQEANVLMNALIATSPAAAAAFKALVMLAVTAFIWWARRYRLVLATSLAAVGVYAALMLYHVVGLAYSGAL